MNVVVLAPYQVCFQGTVYLPGEKVPDGEPNPGRTTGDQDLSSSQPNINHV
jgi:hypothetical protein